MQELNNPKRNLWTTLCTRPQLEAQQLDETVKEVLEAVREGGDEALRFYAGKWEQFPSDRVEIRAEEIERAANHVPEKLKEAIQLASENILRFHRQQTQPEDLIETMPGVRCWRKRVAIEKVGLYIPGGSAPLFSTVLMLGIPAKLAGCSEIILCTPASENGLSSPAVCYAAQMLGIERIFSIGGAQAIAAMAYGTETIPRVDKIFGPGNQYVTKAKELLQLQGIAIDMPAGPSEVLVIADNSSEPEFVAADLLSQAEHGPDSQVLLLSDSRKMINAVLVAIEDQLEQLPRKDIAAKALENSLCIYFPKIKTCLEFSNAYAPEHLIIATKQATKLAAKVQHAGSVFLGKYSCESAGDYASGTNHTLPTNGAARAWSGVSVESFQKLITFQKISAQGIQNLGPAIETMAEAEGLQAHKNAVSIRLKSLSK